MYDTLMQMGRWFGYRPGYVDLCRLFISNEVNGWYRHISIATKELRDEFKYLYETGGTPEHFALKVRLHPGALKITALGKMRNVDDIRVSWAGHLSETYLLYKDSVNITNNLNAAKGLINSFTNAPERKGNNYLWRDVNSSCITTFFNNFILPDSITNFDLPTMVDFINGLVRRGEYTNWSVALMSLNGSPNSSFRFNDHIATNLVLRNDSKVDPNYYGIKKNHIISSSDDSSEEFIDLDMNDLNARYNIANQAFKDNYCQDHPNADLYFVMGDDKLDLLVHLTEKRAFLDAFSVVLYSRENGMLEETLNKKGPVRQYLRSVFRQQNAFEIDPVASYGSSGYGKRKNICNAAEKAVFRFKRDIVEKVKVSSEDLSSHGQNIFAFTGAYLVEKGYPADKLADLGDSVLIICVHDGEAFLGSLHPDHSVILRKPTTRKRGQLEG